jgi:hypothetical protein
LNKKRDALRRGIRDLIENTSRDLAAFEGREPRPDPAASRPAGRPDGGRPEETGTRPSPGAPALNGGAVETAADRAAPPAERPAPPPARAARSEPAPFQLIAEAALLPPAATAGRHPSPRRPAARPAPSKKAKPARPAPRKARRERASGRSGAAAPDSDDAGAEGTSPPHVQPRTGVCRSYFINHECWRVPNAYCNTALQVCVIRKCPVYELNKDVLERRFAKKFKHFW